MNGSDAGISKVKFEVVGRFAGGNLLLLIPLIHFSGEIGSNFKAKGAFQTSRHSIECEPQYEEEELGILHHLICHKDPFFRRLRHILATPILTRF